MSNVAVLATGTWVAQGITALSSLVLPRLYSPEDFGILAICMSVVPILAIVSSLQYQQAIVLPRQDKEASALLGMVFRFAAAGFAITLVLSLLVRLAGPQHVGLKQIPWVTLPVIAAITLFSVLGDAFNYWNIRTESFVLISTAAAASSLTTALLSVGMGVSAAGWWGLLAGVLLGRIVSLSVQAFHGGRLQVIRDGLAVSADRLFTRGVLREYSDFPKFRLPQNLLNTASQNLPAIMLVTLFGPAIGGLYAVAQRALLLPGSLITDAFRRAFYQKAADLHNRGVRLFAASLKATLGLAAIGLIPFGSLVFFGPGLFAMVFGETWRVAGTYAAWLAPWVYVGFCNVPSQAATQVVGLQRQLLIYESVVFVTRIAALGIGAIEGRPIVAIIIYGVTGVALNLALILFVHVHLFRSQAQEGN